MSLYIETEYIPNSLQQKTIDFIMSDYRFPWTFGGTDSSGENSKHKALVHRLVSRAKGHVEKDGDIVSPYFDFFKDIFLEVCKKNDLPVKNIYRAAINNTYHYPDKYGFIHKDHNFPHKQFIWYLNEFTGGPTYLFDDDNNLIKATCVGKNKVAIFDSGNHAQGFCGQYENRYVVIFTFN